MLRGFYLASNGIINQQRIINTVSNNMANVQTAGYKSDVCVGNTFNKELILLNDGNVNKVGSIQYRCIEGTKTTLEQGSFEFTQRPLDVAIQGNVYFNIESEDGEVLLTRNGQFSIDDEGYLELSGSGRVLGENGALQVGTSDFSITNSGEVYVDGKLYDTLALSYIQDSGNVQKEGENTFTLVEGEDGQLPDDVEYSIIQGAFERSNVDIAVEMTKAMEAQSTLESLAQALQMIDAINERAATELAKI